MFAYIQYLFERPYTLRKLICRINKHSCGVVWYNPNGFEPDMHCKNCDDYLG